MLKKTKEEYEAHLRETEIYYIIKDKERIKFEKEKDRKSKDKR